MLLVHADGMSLGMVVTWPGLLLFGCKSNSEFIKDFIEKIGDWSVMSA
jgi:hypothetical protein